MDENNVEVLDMSVEESEMIDTFAGLFDDEPKEAPTMNEEGEVTSDPAVEATENEPEEEFVEIDMSAFVPVTIGEEEIEVTLEELSKSYIREADYTAKVGQLQAKAVSVMEMERKAIEGMELAKLECDIFLEDAKSIDFDSLGAEEYRDAMKKKAVLEKKAAFIKQRMDEMKPRHEAIAAEEKTIKAKSCLTNLQRDVPGFSIDMYNSALGHAVSVLGVDADFIKNCTDAGVIKALIAANENYVSPSRLKKTRMPVKTAKVAKPVTKTTNYSSEADLLALGESLF